MTESPRPIPTFLRYGPVAALAAVELAIFAMALQPRVDAVYRARYIDGTSECWPLPVSGAYSLGEVLNAVEGAVSPGLGNILVCGWLDPAQEGIWSLGRESQLRFHLVEPPASLVLHLDVQPYVPDGSPPQTIVISANGVALATLKLDATAATAQSIPIPASLPLSPAGTLDITFIYPAARAPESLGVSSDGRLLAIHLRSIQLSGG